MQRDQFVEKYLELVPVLRRSAFFYFNSSEDVDDVLQNVFLKAWVHCDALRDDRLFVAWMRQIVRNEALTMLRKRSRMNELLVEDVEETAVLATLEDDWVAWLDIRLTLEQISTSLSESVYLHYLAGYGIGEVAQMMNRPEGTIKSMLYRARKMLNEMCAA